MTQAQSTRPLRVSILIAIVAVSFSFMACIELDPPAEDHTPVAPDDGWKTLFNGRDLTGWTPKIKGHEIGVNYADTFRVEDGLLKVVYKDYEGDFDRRFGHLFYEHEYSSYVLELQYRFTGDQVPGGPGWALRNNGIMIHGQSLATMQKDQDFPVSIEVQLLGGDGEKERHTGNLCTPGTHVEMKGKLIKRHCIDSNSATFHGDQWVSIRIEVRGNESIKHIINGEVVLEYEKPQLDERDANAQSWIEKRGGDKMLGGGSISLQAESHPCEFRFIRLKQL